MWWDVIHKEPHRRHHGGRGDCVPVWILFSISRAQAANLGRSDVKLISADNVFGNDPSDPLSEGRFSVRRPRTAVNKAVRIRLNSRDVIHGFYIPQFRIYQDAVPGRTIDWVWFIPTKIGSYDLACSQLCGSGHYNMKAQIEVVSQAGFRQMV